MNKKELKLKNKWLQKLRKALKLLAEDDANDIIDSYDEKITEEFAELNDIQIVLAQLTDVEIIAREIYTELGISYQTKPKREQKPLKKSKAAKLTTFETTKGNSKSIGWKLILTLPNILMAFLAFFLSLTSLSFYIGTFILVIGFPFMTTIFFITYDITVALGLFVLVLGLIPLFAIIFWYTAKFFEKSTKVVINGIFMVYTEQRPFAKLFEKSVINKIMLILALVFATLVGFGAAINLAPENSLLSSNYNGNYRYTQVTEIKVGDKITKPTSITLDFNGLSSYMHTPVIETKDTNLEFGTFILIRHYNIKEKYHLTTNVDIENHKSIKGNNYKISFDSQLPWNAIVGVTSFEKYEISYNFDVNSGEVD